MKRTVREAKRETHLIELSSDEYDRLRMLLRILADKHHGWASTGGPQEPCKPCDECSERCRDWAHNLDRDADDRVEEYE